MSKGITQSRCARIVLLSTLALPAYLATSAVTALAREPQGKGCQLVPPIWVPSLDQVRDEVEKSANAQTNVPQQVLTQTSQNLADLRDAQLFITYVELMQTLDVKAQAALFAEQKAWLAKRSQSAQAAVTSKGGTLGPLEYSGAFAKLTEDRRVELQRRLQRQRAATDGKEKHTP